MKPACPATFHHAEPRFSSALALPLVYLVSEHRAVLINTPTEGRVVGWRLQMEQLSPPPLVQPSAGLAISRLDRLSVWSLPRLFIGIIGVGFLFTFYDIFDINVSFIQTCVAIVPDCRPETAAQHLGLPVLLNLVGYVIGTLALSPLADRAGRRDLLLVTMVISGCLWRAA